MPVAPKPIQLTSEQAREVSDALSRAIEVGESQRGTYLSKLRENRKLLNTDQPRPNPPWTGACGLSLPMVKWHRNVLLANYVGTLTSVSPIYNVEGKPAADQVENFMEDLITKEQALAFHDTLETILASAIDDGTCVARVTRRKDVRQRTHWVKGNNGVDGEPAWVRKRGQVTAYDGPAITVIPVENVGTWPPRCASIQRSVGVYVLSGQTGDEMRRLADGGEYDEEAVKSLESAPADEKAQENVSEDERGLTIADTGEFGSRPFQVADCEWRVSVGGKPVEDWLVTMHRASKTILRAIPTPWASGERHLVLFRPWQDKFGILGDSIVDLAGQPQQFIVTLLRMLVDGTALQMFPEMAVAKSALGTAGLREMKKRRGPMGVVPIEDGWFDKIKPFVQATGSLQMAIPVIELLMNLLERGTGISPSRQAVPTPRAITATEIEEMLQEGDKLQRLTSQRVARSTSEVGRLMLWICYEFLGAETVQKHWRSVLGQQAGEGILGAQEIGGDYTVMAAGSSESSNRALQQKRAQQVLDMVVENPASTPQQIYKARLRYLNALGERNPEQYIGTEEEFVQNFMRTAQAMAGQQAQQGMVVGGGQAVPSTVQQPQQMGVA
jgi:hypothetical protein